ncbi:hypothetical protein MED297_11395 [Reinekea sp. MED297]|uniref:Uncharacterized protein n=1 Tax=Reinekea blandensis MED297 TaxID=314283 RepID=A4BB04_9GAMM|nr:hypothetical protein MED297_11395 [Reinekea sp. MED297] [Reinekea blandensis MED297]
MSLNWKVVWHLSSAFDGAPGVWVWVTMSRVDSVFRESSLSVLERLARLEIFSGNQEQPCLMIRQNSVCLLKDTQASEAYLVLVEFWSSVLKFVDSDALAMNQCEFLVSGLSTSISITMFCWTQQRFIIDCSDFQFRASDWRTLETLHVEYQVRSFNGYFSCCLTVHKL